MSQDLTPLSELRRQIDEIDTQIHDLLMRRAEVVQAIGSVKGSTALAFRPGREASVLRRLAQRHRGPFPKRLLVRIWREIFAAATAIQGDFKVAYWAPAEGSDLRGLARDHFGALTPLIPYSSPTQVVQQVCDVPGTVGVLPLPQGEDPDPWWRILARDGEAAPRIVARLPFAAEDQKRSDVLQALAVGLQYPEATGEDHGYLLLETSEEMSRGGLRSRVEKAGFEPLDSFANRESENSWLHLVEVEGMVKPGDPRLERLVGEDQPGIAQVWAAGGYALPLAITLLDEVAEAQRGVAQ
jgi:chorismate mutase/prephenate dehydratase